MDSTSADRAMAEARKTGQNLARPAEALLASDIISDQEVGSLLNDIWSSKGHDVKRKKRRELLTTNVKSLDDALGGGVGFGNIVTVNEEAGAGGSEICRALLASSLLKHERSTAAVIDTTGNFDILALYAILLAKLRQNVEIPASSRLPSNPAESIDDVAARTLDRVKIMRVFDYVGVTEAVHEIRDELGQGSSKRPAMNKDIKVTKAENNAVKEPSPLPSILAHAPPKAPPKRTFVADSEDEGDDEDELLFDSDSQLKDNAAVQQISTGTPSITEPEDAVSGIQADHSSGRGKVSVIFIDNISQILLPLFKKDSSQGTSLTAAFLRTLSDLKTTHGLAIVLLLPTNNSTTTMNISMNTNTLDKHSHHYPNVYLPRPNLIPTITAPTPSIFTSTPSTLLPILTPIFTSYTDLTLLISRVPRRRIDARIYFEQDRKPLPNDHDHNHKSDDYKNSSSGDQSGSGATQKKEKRGVQRVSVMEVVTDRWEGRVGAWGVFCLGKQGEGIKGVTFS